MKNRYRPNEKKIQAGYLSEYLKARDGLGLISKLMENGHMIRDTYVPADASLYLQTTTGAVSRQVD